ncbi:Itaconate transport protein [Colletotrichum spinosum]|uniref:Itaconate transport protein n=1 Tax=Colletotrichum spinosum TaxID=1347390 RepID=A0A4V3HRN5_9PEZI|nr:Itaconate transport protein [Colletotrichum spinosum]
MIKVLRRRKKWTEATEKVHISEANCGFSGGITVPRIDLVVSAMLQGHVEAVRQYLESSKDADILLHGVQASKAPQFGDSGSRSNSLDAVDSHITGETALHLAACEAYREMVQLLLEKGADPNARDVSGQVPLMRAAFWGRLENVKVLLRYGAVKNAWCVYRGLLLWPADFVRPLRSDKGELLILSGWNFRFLLENTCDRKEERAEIFGLLSDDHEEAPQKQLIAYFVDNHLSLSKDANVATVDSVNNVEDDVNIQMASLSLHGPLNGLCHQPHIARRHEEELLKPEQVKPSARKWVVIVIIGSAGLFSGLSSNIYFPSLEAISQDLHVSLEMVSLTITSYLIIQGISPLFWGSISDALGRRPIYMASFAVYIIANIGLSFSPNFGVLMVFRGLQAAGSASTVSIGNGVIQDISPPSERGEFIAFYQAIRNFSIAVGPVLGGLLANFLGFRSIFVLLLILSSIVTTVIVVFLPETMRSIAGNGSLRLGGVYKPLIRYLTKEAGGTEDPEGPLTRNKVTLATFVEPLRLLVQRDILINLIFGGVVYTVWSMVTSSTTGLFKKHFHLSELQIGLAFLPNGFGTIVGSAIAGKLMTRDYLEIEETYKSAHNLAETEKLTAKNMPVDFPIERARLRRLPWIILIFVVSTGGYGVCLNFPSVTSLTGWIAVPLVLQFLIAATSNAVFALNQTLVTDLCPGKGASATAINNLVRCGLGAIGVAFIENFIASTGPAVTFLALALITVAVGPLAVVHWYWGQEWRAQRVRSKDNEDDGKTTA